MDLQIIQRAVKFLGEDVSLDEPQFANTIFSGQELNLAADLKLSTQLQIELMEFLVAVHYCEPLSKSSPFGQYYNVTAHLYLSVHPCVRTNRFVNKQIDPQQGWCLTYTSERVIRLACEGTACKFYYSAEKRCVHNKVFFLAKSLSRLF